MTILLSPIRSREQSISFLGLLRNSPCGVKRNQPRRTGSQTLEARAGVEPAFTDLQSGA